MTWPGLPVLVKLAERPVILLGEGDAADAKRRLLERAGARVIGDDGLSSKEGARLAIVAIEDEAEALAAVAGLRARGVLVNAVDRPELCDFTLPAVVDRAPVLVAVMTGGVSAGLAAALRQRLEALLPASLGRLAEALGAARDRLRARWPDAGARRRAIGAALMGELDPLDAGAAARVEEGLFRHAGSVPASTSEEDASPSGGHDGGPRRRPVLSDGAGGVEGAGVTIALHSAEPDELTLWQARALALADRVLHASDIPAPILARARADAPRVALGQRPAQVAAGEVWVEMRR